MPILLKSLLKEDGQPEFSFMKDVPVLKSIKDITPLFPEIVENVQQVYDQWDQSDPEGDPYGGGGICDDIADAIADVLNANGIEAATINSGGMEENHTWAIAKVREGVVEVDIPYSKYERGHIIRWTKIPDVTFTTNDIHMGLLDPDPHKFEEFLS